MQWLIVVFYTVLFTILFIKWKKLADENISTFFIASLFIVKCFLAVLYIYVHYRYYGGGDLTQYHKDGLIVYHTLFTNPIKYGVLVLAPNGFNPIPQIIAPEVDKMGLWWDKGLYAVVRFYAFTNIFTFGYLYATGIFAAFASTIGLVFIYKSACSVFPQKNTLIAMATFGIPSVLFFSSGAHKESLLICSMGIFFYYISKLLTPFDFKKHFWLYILLSSFFIWLLRDFVFYLMLPGFFAFCCSLFMKKYLPLNYLLATVFFAAIALFVKFSDVENQVAYSGNFLEIIKLKQSLFLSLKGGNSNIDIQQFRPQITYLIQEIPLAFSRCFFAPFYLSSFNAYQLLIVIENTMIAAFALFLIVHISIKKIAWNALSLWHVFFAVSNMVLIGIVVNNIGAIIRYRSILFPLLFIFLISLVDMKKIKTTVSKFFFAKQNF